MLVSKKKLQLLKQMFSVPYRPALSKYQSDKFDKINFGNNITDCINNKSVATPFSNSLHIKNSSIERTFDNGNIKKTMSFPSYEFNSNINSNINYSIDDYSHSLYYPLRNEIIIKNPEEIIRSGCLQGSIRIDNNNNNNNPNEHQNMNMNINNIINELNNFDEKFNQKSGVYNNYIQNNNQNVNNLVQQNSNILEQKKTLESEINNDNMKISTIIPGKLTETVKLDQNELRGLASTETKQIENSIIDEEKVSEPAEQQQDNIITKKYQINTNNDNVVVLPPNYSTDDEDEYKAITTLNEDLSSWKKYAEKDGLKLYFKPYPVKDEKGNDAESCIGFLEAILDFPASHVINKLNDFNFRKNVDDQYEKGKLLSEKMIEGNIKVMEMYLYMKMPFIFSDRDFVVQKKCWLDYNGNKDHALFYIHSIENSQYPAKEKPVRGNYENRSGYVKPLGPNQCKINIVTAMDVKMSLGYSTMAKNGAEMQEKWVKKFKKELAK